MKVKSLFMMLSVMLALAGANCSSDTEQTEQQPSIKERVASAKIVPGEVQEFNLGSIYFHVPSKGGYLVFDVKNDAEKREIADEVYLRFKAEYDANTDRNLKELSLSSNSGRVHYTCGNWRPISDDPHSRVYRYCCNLDTGSCYREMK